LSRDAPLPQTQADDAILQALLRRIALRDSAALASLYDLTLGRIHGPVLRVLRNPSDSEGTLGDPSPQARDQARDPPSRVPRLTPMAPAVALSRHRVRPAGRPAAHPRGGGAWDPVGKVGFPVEMHPVEHRHRQHQG